MTLKVINDTQDKITHKFPGVGGAVGGTIGHVAGPPKVVPAT